MEPFFEENEWWSDTKSSYSMGGLAESQLPGKLHMWVWVFDISLHHSDKRQGPMSPNIDAEKRRGLKPPWHHGAILRGCRHSDWHQITHHIAWVPAASLDPRVCITTGQIQTDEAQSKNELKKSSTKLIISKCMHAGTKRALKDICVSVRITR